MEEDNLCETRMEVNFFGTQQQFLVVLPHQRHEEGAYQKYVEMGFNEHVSFPKLLHYFGLVKKQGHSRNACEDGDDLIKP